MAINTMENKVNKENGNQNSNKTNPANKKKYYWLSNLSEIGLKAKLVDNKILLGPKDKLSQKIIDIVNKNRQAIIAEINQLEMSQAKSEVEENAWTDYPPNRYSDPSHDLDKVMEVWSECYRMAAKLYLLNPKPYTACWHGSKVKPPRPYFYVKDVKLNNPKSEDGHQITWQYLIMLADVDNQDYVVSEEFDYEFNLDKINNSNNNSGATP